MFKNDNIIPPAEATPASSNTKKCVSALKTALKHRETLPFIRKTTDSPDLQNTSNASEIKSGITLKRVYNIEKAEVVNPNPKFLNKEKNKEKSKVLDKKYHSQTDAHNRREARRAQKKKELSNAQAKRRPKPKPTVPKVNEQLNKQKKREIAEKALSERKCLPEKTVLPPANKKSLEQRLTTKIWQILSRDMFLLDHEQFNNQIQATNSETKKYIISVIKRCNNKELKKLCPTSTLTQTTKESKMKVAIKCALRRRLWAVAKASIKHSKHWSQFLAENNIILENINIDKFDLSLIDLEALGIENKVLKRTLTWLFK